LISLVEHRSQLARTSVLNEPLVLQQLSCRGPVFWLQHQASLYEPAEVINVPRRERMGFIQVQSEIIPDRSHWVFSRGGVRKGTYEHLSQSSAVRPIARTVSDIDLPSSLKNFVRSFACSIILSGIGCSKVSVILASKSSSRFHSPCP
jgi:hypothetical protein